MIADACSSWWPPHTLRVMATALVAAALVCRAPAASAQDEAASPAAAKLAEDFNDPLTTLPQLFIQDAYSPANYGTDAQTNKLIIRPIIPRIPRYSLLPFVQLIRPSFSVVTVPVKVPTPGPTPVVTVPTGRASATRTEFGDLGLFDLAIIPWPPKGSGLLMGVGPVFVFPTATDKTAGQGAWQVGPAFGTIYKGIPGILLGCLIQNPISFAYQSSERKPLDTLLFQPVLLAHVWRGLYVKSADSTWTFGWRARSATTVPLSFGLGWVILGDGSTPVNVFVSGEWMAYHQDAPIAPQTTVRFGVNIAFPELKLWEGF